MSQAPIAVTPVNPSVVRSPNVGDASGQGTIVQVGISGPYLFSAYAGLIQNSLAGNPLTMFTPR